MIEGIDKLDEVHFSIAREFVLSDYENLSKFFRKEDPMLLGKKMVVDVQPKLHSDITIYKILFLFKH